MTGGLPPEGDCPLVRGSQGTLPVKPLVDLAIEGLHRPHCYCYLPSFERPVLSWPGPVLSVRLQATVEEDEVSILARERVCALMHRCRQPDPGQRPSVPEVLRDLRRPFG